MNLQQLDFSHNQISQIPDTIGNLGNLQGLYLYHNQISQIPDDTIGNLVNLRGLYLDENRLTALSALQINRLTLLRVLDYSNNEIQEEPDINLNLNTHSYINNPFTLQAGAAGAGLPQNPTPNQLIAHIGTAANLTPADFSALGLEEMNTSLHLWLFSLVHAKDFTSGSAETKAHFAKRILSVLDYAAKNPDYKRDTFDMVLSDQTCSDRATLALDNLEISKEIEEAGGSTEESAVVRLDKSVHYRNFRQYRP